MRLSMLKLLTSIALLSSAISLSAIEETASDAKVLQYVKQSITANENYTLEKVAVVKKEPLPDVINALYTLNINRFNGIDKVQMRLEKFQAADAPVYVHSAEFKDGPNGLHI